MTHDDLVIAGALQDRVHNRVAALSEGCLGLGTRQPFIVTQQVAHDSGGLQGTLQIRREHLDLGVLGDPRA